MPHWFHPPGPFVGGRQPYANKDLTPAAENNPPSNPPFSNLGRLALIAGVLGLWQPDPSLASYRFEGGRQPFAPEVAPPSGLDNPPSNPPFREAVRGAVFQAEIVGAWQPDPWQYIYGGWARASKQPYGVAQLPPSKLDNPPSNPPVASEGRANWLPSIIQAWQPDPDLTAYRYAGARQPYAPRNLAPSIINNPADNPPFRWLDTIFEPFLPPDPLPTQPNLKKLSPSQLNVTPDNPPFGWLETLFEPFLGDPPLPTLIGKLSPGIPGQSVDAPPQKRPERPETYVFWQPPDPQPQSIGKLSPGIPGQSVDNPPQLATRVAAYTDQWTAPQQQHQLAPGIPGQSVDNPPAYVRQLPQQVDVLPLPWRPSYVPQTPVASQNTYVPAWLPTIISSWALSDQPPTLPRLLNAGLLNVTPDNPPFGLLETIFEPFLGDPDLPTVPKYLVQGTVSVQVPYSQIWLSPVIAAWQISDPLPILPRQLSAGIPGQSVDNPPQISTKLTPYVDSPSQYQSAKQLSPGIPGQSVDNPSPYARQMAQPQDAYPALWQPRFVPQVAAAVAQNPYTPAWLTVVLNAWLSSDAQPTLPRRLYASLLNVTPDNPPFGLLETIFEPFLGDQPQPTLPRFIIQGAAVSVQVPANFKWFATVLASWQPSDPLPTLSIRSAGIPGWSVDNPPGLPATDLLALDFAGQLPQRGAVFPQGATIDNPPSSYAGRLAYIVNVVLAWQLPDPLPTLPRYVAQAAPVPDNPPFTTVGRATYLVNVLQGWQPPAPQPVQRGPLNPSVLNVTPDNPPFGQLDTIIEPWLNPFFPQYYSVTVKTPQGAVVPPVTEAHFRYFFADMGSMMSR